MKIRISAVLLIIFTLWLSNNEIIAQEVKSQEVSSQETQNQNAEIKQLEEKVEAFAKLTKALSNLSLGGYGEAVMSRNFYSDNFNRYSQPATYKNKGYHNRADLPHVTFFIGYEFGNGWRMNSEIEFEHGGNEVAVELESDESGEYETEVERGGEVALEQFWIEKTFNPMFNLRMGQIIVPIGYTNGNHLPNQFFTVYRPQGENTILPCTWREVGVSLWGFLTPKWRYELQVVPGLDSELFSRKNWIQGGSASPYEFKVANKFAGVARVDNYSIPGLRLGVSGYIGQSFKNSMQPPQAEKYKDIKGTVYIGSFDFDYKGYNLVARGYFDYGHLANSKIISEYNKTLSKYSTSPRSSIASDAICVGVQVGYDIFSQIDKMRNKQKFYVFGGFEYYDSMYKTDDDIIKADWAQRKVLVGGVNYCPNKNIVFKADYSAGILKKPYNNENTLSVGVAYVGWFL